MAHTTYLVCLASTVSGCCKKEKKSKNALEDAALAAGT
jgi:hypothetical protein